MTVAKGMSGLVVPAASTQLDAHYKVNFDDGTGLADSSGNSRDLTGASSAGFWSTRQGVGSFDGTSDEFSIGDTTSLELGTASGPITLIISCRLNRANAIGQSNASLIGKREATTGVCLEVNASVASGNSGVIKFNVNNSGTYAGPNVADGADHHIVLTSENGGDQTFYVDDVAITPATASVLDCTNTAEFMIGARNSAASPLSRFDDELWDVQIYTPDSIPANITDIVHFLYTHPYRALPASLLP